MNLSWSARARPLAVEGCWAEGAAAAELQAKLTRRALKLQTAHFQDGLVVLGSEVPWVDGATFLGREGQIYMPTMWQPNLPYEWLVAGLARKAAGPWVLLTDQRVLTLP
ncbi:MAG: hypothetical protein KF760_05590 [Candidatus Eremiobacteraeota bacterium]|nr:hypothetical protein [Candidatus Eremiobacteraeota bacterium]MCW5870054.1 hypothetical protein [Candidatus Eremiobacteraeota bacterium]